MGQNFIRELVLEQQRAAGIGRRGLVMVPAGRPEFGVHRGRVDFDACRRQMNDRRLDKSRGDGGWLHSHTAGVLIRGANPGPAGKPRPCRRLLPTSTHPGLTKPPRK